MQLHFLLAGPRLRCIGHVYTSLTQHIVLEALLTAGLNKKNKTRIRVVLQNNKEYITLLVYKNNGKRVYYPFDPPPYIDGVRYMFMRVAM